MSKQRQPATGYRPSGRQCAECKHAAEDCSGIDFAQMAPAGKPDADGVQRVRCAFYERAAARIDGRRVVDYDFNGAPILEGRELLLPRYDGSNRPGIKRRAQMDATPEGRTLLAAAKEHLHINLMGALGDPDYMRGSLSCRHVDTRTTKLRSKKA